MTIAFKPLLLATIFALGTLGLSTDAVARDRDHRKHYKRHNYHSKHHNRHYRHYRYGHRPRVYYSTPYYYGPRYYPRYYYGRPYYGPGVTFSFGL